ncbi:MAG TPA: outer membrane beta-barrel protein [Bacteroidota bacterium]|nr:outer membrane beta-barrel protein [Bacteroidota bacterium]
MRTLKLTSSFLLIFVLLMPAESQIIRDFGIKAGVSISDIQVTYPGIIPVGYQTLSPEYQDNVANPSVSCFADVFTSDYFDAQVELSYMRKGATRTSTSVLTTPDDPAGFGQTVSITNEIGLHYLGLALIAQPSQPLGDARLYTIVGPTFSYLLSSSGFAELPGQLNNFEVGYTAGIGFDPSKMVKANVFIEIRYEGELREFYDSGAKFRNRSWLFCVGTMM